MTLARSFPFEWYWLPDAGNEPEATAEALRSLDENASIDLSQLRSALPIDVGVVVAGTVGLTVLARRIIDLVCRARRRGLVIDTRIIPVHITESAELPGGAILAIAPTGDTSLHDACSPGFDLEALLLELLNTT